MKWETLKIISKKKTSKLNLPQKRDANCFYEMQKEPILKHYLKKEIPIYQKGYSEMLTNKQTIDSHQIPRSIVKTSVIVE